MRGHSDESQAKFDLLNVIVPLMLHAVGKVKHVLFADVFCGPGLFDNPALGLQMGSPGIFYNALRHMSDSIRRTLILIDDTASVFFDLVKFLGKLPIARNLLLLPELGDCHTLMTGVIKSVGPVDHKIVFSDPCGLAIPYGLAKLARDTNTTVILRYSIRANRRTHTTHLRDDLKAFDMPYWLFHPGVAGGDHEYNILVGTHNKAIAEVCSGAMQPIESPIAALDLSMSKSPDYEKAKTTKAVPLVVAGNKPKQRTHPLIGHGPIKALSSVVVAQMQQLRREGKTYPVIAKACGVSETSVWRHVKNVKSKAPKPKANTKASSKPKARARARLVASKVDGRKRYNLDLSQLQQLRKDGMTNVAISKLFGVSNETIRKRLSD